MRNIPTARASTSSAAFRPLTPISLAHYILQCPSRALCECTVSLNLEGHFAEREMHRLAQPSSCCTSRSRSPSPSRGCGPRRACRSCSSTTPLSSSSRCACAAARDLHDLLTRQWPASRCTPRWCSHRVSPACWCTTSLVRRSHRCQRCTADPEFSSHLILIPIRIAPISTLWTRRVSPRKTRARNRAHGVPQRRLHHPLPGAALHPALVWPPRRGVAHHA